MSPVFVALLLFAFSTCSANKIDCTLVDCAQKVPTPEDCLKKGLAFVPRDGKSICCDRCSKVEDVIVPPKCEPNLCASLTCIPAKIGDCKPDQVLVPADAKCICCTACLDRKKTPCH